MKEVYKSKVGFAIIFPICMIGGMLIAMIILRVWPAACILACVGAFILHMFFNTYYTISGTGLNIKSGFIINTTVDIGNITKIVPSTSMLSSPALSMDRLEMSYNKYDSILISPEDKAGFIAQLKTINPAIITS